MGLKEKPRHDSKAAKPEGPGTGHDKEIESEDKKTYSYEELIEFFKDVLEEILMKNSSE